MNIIIFIESRADRPGLRPIFREAKKRGHKAQIVADSSPERDFDLVCDADWFICLGDRPGVLKAVIEVAERYRNIGIVHLSGGDRQEGALVDEAVRHSLSKFAHVHFPCLDESAARLIRQGESEDRIYNVGSTFVDDLVDFTPVLNSQRGKYTVIQMHPAPGWQEDLEWILQEVSEKAIILAPNDDPGFGVPPVIEYTTPNLPRGEYLQLIWNSRAFIGNSSALFLEAQYLGVPCIQVGERNKGREEAFPGHVVRWDPRENFPGGKDARKENGLRENWKEGAHGEGTASEKILDILDKIGIPGADFLKKEWE